MRVFLVNGYSKFGGSHKFLTHNGSEFKNKSFAQVASTLEMKQIFSSPYYPQGDGHIENVNNLLKACIQKHVS